MEQNSSFCQQSKDKNSHPIIHNICSFIDALEMNTFLKKECHFKHPVEGHWAIGKLMTLVYKFTKNQHCSAINIHKYLTESPKITQSDKKYTILINTWQRNECLIKSVKHYLSCNEVAQIRVIWSDPSNDVPHSLKALQATEHRLIFDEYKDDKLTNRFKYNAQWITDGIFQTDDDIMFSCALLANTFKLWQLFPNYSIGFAPRHPLNDESFMRDTTQQFYQWDGAYSECEYSLIFPTLGGFMHRKYYQMYTENDVDGWEEIKKAVDGNITAEDISMSLLHTFMTEYAPIIVTVPESEMLIDDFLSCTGQQSLTMHTNSGEKRTKIFLDILRVFGYFDEEQKFELVSSKLWVDVMPFDEQKCWAG